MSQNALTGLPELVAILDAGSISAAADALGLPRATVSRRLAALEDELGVRLVQRTTRQLSATAAGAALAADARAVLAQLAAARDAALARDGQPRGRLRVSAPPSTELGPLGALVGEYMALYPEVQLEVEVTARYVDLVAEGVDVALRGGVVHDEGLVARRLLRGRMVVVASPAYLAAHGPLERPADLATHRCLGGVSQHARGGWRWPLWAGGAVVVQGPLVCNSLPLVCQAVLDGVGVGLVPELMVAPALADGRLVVVLPEVGGPTELSLVYPSRTLVSPALRAFIDLAAARLPAWLDQGPAWIAPRPVPPAAPPA